MMIDLYKGVLYNGKDFSALEDAISIELALNIAVNGKAFTITMQTPGNEIDLTRGLLFTEGIILDLSKTPQVQITQKNAEGFVTAVNVIVPPELVIKDFANTRNVISASSCGVCGKTELDLNETVPITTNEKLKAELVPNMFEQINRIQKNFQVSGGTHAAGAFNIKGELITMQEDIGRHNAVDKVIGYLINHELLDQAKCITVSGRISYEIVSKTKAAKIPFLAAVSAPSSLAIDNAQEAGITLMAFCRNTKFTAYTHPENIVMGDFKFTSGKVKTN